MVDDRIEGIDPDETLKFLVKKFSMLEGRQPRVMVCRSREYQADTKINEISVDLAGFGFDVDIGIPFNSVGKLGMNAIENDVDVLVLFTKEDDSDRDFISKLEGFLSQKGYSDILIINQAPDSPTVNFTGELINWLKQALQ